MVCMSTHNDIELGIEKFLQEKHDPEARNDLPSNAEQIPASDRLDQLVLPDESRGKMPLTKDRYLVRENPHLIQWERETRKFLRNLSPAHGHRVSATMVYEWATGIKVTDLMAEGKSASPDLKLINKSLEFYFGKSYTTWIAGRKVGKCYRVPVGTYIRRRRPMTLALWAEWREGVLNP